MTVVPTEVLSGEQEGAGRAVALLTAFIDGTQHEDPDEWDGELLFKLMDELQQIAGISDENWTEISNVLIAMMIMLDFAIEYTGHDKFDTLASLASLLHRSFCGER